MEKVNVMFGLPESLVTGLVISVITAWLAIRFSIHRFHQEKWWEKKHEIYTDLLYSLYFIKNYYAETFEAQIDPNHLTPERKKELTDNLQKASRQFDKHCEIASFQLCKEASNILKECSKKKDAAVSEN